MPAHSFEMRSYFTKFSHAILNQHLRRGWIIKLFLFNNLIARRILHNKHHSSYCSLKTTHLYIPLYLHWTKTPIQITLDNNLWLFVRKFQQAMVSYRHPTLLNTKSHLSIPNAWSFLQALYSSQHVVMLDLWVILLSTQMNNSKSEYLFMLGWSSLLP